MLLASASVFLARGRAFAEPAAPTVSELVADPADEHHLALRANYGLLISRDAGKSWHVSCKAGMGYEGRGEPALAILPSGTLVLGASSGLIRGDAAGCNFSPAVGPDGDVVDVAALPTPARGALAVSVSFADSSSRVWQSLDDAKSFHALSAVLPHFTALTLAVPSASPLRVYLSGLSWGKTVAGAIAVSRDGGKTFAVNEIPNSDAGSQPLIAAVDPQNPNTIYLRFSGTPGKLKVSTDGGVSFREVLSLPGPLQAFALASDGTKVFASSLEAGTYTADTSSLTFVRIACDGVPCLVATSQGLLACGDSSRHGFIVGRSLDEGRSFARVLDAHCVAPASCGPKTTVGAACGRDWQGISDLLEQSQVPCGRSAPTRPTNRACFEDAGAIRVDTPSRIARAAPRSSPRVVSNWLGCAYALLPPGAARQRARPLLVLLMACILASRYSGRPRRRTL